MATLYLMYRRIKISKGVWLGDSFEVIARFESDWEEGAWVWKDTENGLVVDSKDWFLEDYLKNLFD